MSDMKHLRKKLYINREVQGSIICRSILHWFFYLTAILLTVVIVAVIRDPSQSAIRLVFESFIYFSPGIIASVILLPLMVYDTLRESNKVAGPIFRLSREISNLAAGANCKPLKFRDGDHWFEVADNYNELLTAFNAQREEIEQLRQELSTQKELVG